MKEKLNRGKSKPSRNNKGLDSDKLEPEEGSEKNVKKAGNLRTHSQMMAGDEDDNLFAEQNSKNKRSNCIIPEKQPQKENEEIHK